MAALIYACISSNESQLSKTGTLKDSTSTRRDRLCETKLLE